MAYIGYNTRRTQFKIYSLFLLVDGKWTSEEELNLVSIADKLELSGEDRKRILQCCKELPIIEGDNASYIIQIVDQMMGFTSSKSKNSAATKSVGITTNGEIFGVQALVKNALSGISIPSISSKGTTAIDQLLSDVRTGEIKWNANLQAEIIWTLVNLAYADEEYSEPEKKYIQHLVDKLEIKPELFSEFVDTADTILLLTKQKDWLKSIGLSYDKTTERLETIDEQIQLMIDNIQETISEASAV